MAAVQYVGPHRLEIEGDLVMVRNEGPYTLEHMQETCALFSEILRAQGRLFTISDFSRAGSFESAARRYAAEWSRDHWVSGTVIFGTGKAARVSLTLMVRAAELLTRKPRILTFVETEAQARAWVAEQRSKLLARASHR